MLNPILGYSCRQESYSAPLEALKHDHLASVYNCDALLSVKKIVFSIEETNSNFNDRQTHEQQPPSSVT
jgi:hypothetical protein